MKKMIFHEKERVKCCILGEGIFCKGDKEQISGADAPRSPWLFLKHTDIYY